MSFLTVELRGIEVFGYHGVLFEERRQGQRFLFDVQLEVESPAPTTDRIQDAVDYRDVVALVQEISDRHRFNLLEALAQAVADAMIGRFPVERAQVTVRKPEVVLEPPVEHAGVTAYASASGEAS